MSGKGPGLIPAGLRRAGNPGGGGGGGSVASTDITDASTAGRNMLTAASAAAQRALLALAAIATSGVSADITDATAAGRALLTAASAALQRTALGLAAIAASGASADITDSTAPGRALLTAATAALQRTALGLAAIAASGASADITDSTAPGRALLTAATAALQRTALGLAAIAASGASADITDATAAGRALLTAASAALQRTALGLATVASSGLASDLSGTVALANGGTGQTSALAAADALSGQSTSLAGGNTVDLATATGPVVTITGTGFTISSFGTRPAGAKQTIVFASSGGAIIHHATALICPFGASIVVTAGDVYEMTSLGGGLWRMTGYLPITASFWRTALGLAAMASSAVAANITDASAVGRSMLTAANQAAQTALIAVATQALAGLMSAADKLKVDQNVEEPIDDQLWTAQTVYTSPTWTANKYRNLRFEITVVSGCAGYSALTLVGLTGTYRSNASYGNPSSGVGSVPWTADWKIATFAPAHILGQIFTRNVGVYRAITFDSFAAAGGQYTFSGNGDNDDTTHDVTGLVMTMAASGTFRFRLWGTLT